jgi:hypothetical protein
MKDTAATSTAKLSKGSRTIVAERVGTSGLSDGPHRIYLKAMNQAGKADPTPAKWTLTLINDYNDD